MTAVKHLPVVGLREIEDYADKQEYFMQAVATHHSTVIKDYFSYLFKPEPLWKQLYLMVMNERETFLRFPKEAFRYWLRHDNWSVSSIQSKPKAMIQWQNCTFRERRALETTYLCLETSNITFCARNEGRLAYKLSK